MKDTPLTKKKYATEHTRIGRELKLKAKALQNAQGFFKSHVEYIFI